MKALTLFFISLIGSAYGQITLTDQHFSGANESFVISTTTDPLIDYNFTGANVAWDFTTLVATGQKGYITKPMTSAALYSQLLFGSFAPLAYKATYFASTTDLPLAQLTTALPVSIEDISLFTKKTATAINSVGYELLINGQGIAVKSDTIEKRYALPLNFGDTYNSRGYTALDMNPIYNAQWRQHLSRSSVVDGYGAITTPFGTFSALRIKHEITENDSIYLAIGGTSGFWLPLPIPVAYEYEWRAVEEKEPILVIKTSVTLGTETVTAIEYRDQFLGLGIAENAIEVIVGPNPANDQLNVSSAAIIEQWSLINSDGRVVHAANHESSSLSINLCELATGQYHLVLVTAKGISYQKFIKQ
jgi:hypothetical protein